MKWENIEKSHTIEIELENEFCQKCHSIQVAFYITRDSRLAKRNHFITDIRIHQHNQNRFQKLVRSPVDESESILCHIQSFKTIYTELRIIPHLSRDFERNLSARRFFQEAQISLLLSYWKQNKIYKLLVEETALTDFT